MTPTEFIGVIRELVDLRDFSYPEQVSKILRFDLERKDIAGKTLLEPITQPSWLFRLEYPFPTDNPTQRITFFITEDTLCVRAEDIWQEFGRDYIRLDGPMPSFSNQLAREEFERKSKEGHQLFGIGYQLGGNPKVGLGFHLFFGKCVSTAGIALMPH
jgi:hypothetical protein